MSNLTISIPHNLSQGEALKRIKNALAQAKAEHSGKIKNLQENWNGSVGTLSGSAMGHAASGTITVNASEIVFDLALPFAASLFKGKIEAGIRGFAAGLLA
jgi:putative polyhydroxyalkanoic acid system protein